MNWHICRGFIDLGCDQAKTLTMMTETVLALMFANLFGAMTALPFVAASRTFRLRSGDPPNAAACSRAEAQALPVEQKRTRSRPDEGGGRTTHWNERHDEAA
jgi:hypothetical protein